MSATESNINKLVENVLEESEPVVIIKYEAPKPPRDISLITKPTLIKLPSTFAKKFIEKALNFYADTEGKWFRRFIRMVNNPQLHIDLNTVINNMVKDIIKDEDESSFAFNQHKQMLTMQAMGSLSEISDMLWQRLTQSSTTEQSVTTKADGKEITIITKRTILPALDHLNWELSNNGIEYTLDGKFICHLQQIEGRAAVFNSSPIFKTEYKTEYKPKTTTDDEGFETVHYTKPKNDESTNPNYRTVPCKFFTETGSCKYGDKCTFLHNSTGEQAIKSCNFGEKCNRKDTCRFSHEPASTAAASIAGTYAAKAAEPVKPKPTAGFTGKANAGAGKA
jgi:hypothetical protein